MSGMKIQEPEEEEIVPVTSYTFSSTMMYMLLSCFPSWELISDTAKVCDMMEKVIESARSSNAIYESDRKGRRR